MMNNYMQQFFFGEKVCAKNQSSKFHLEIFFFMKEKFIIENISSLTPFKLYYFSKCEKLVCLDKIL